MSKKKIGDGGAITVMTSIVRSRDVCDESDNKRV